VPGDPAVLFSTQQLFQPHSVKEKLTMSAPNHADEMNLDYSSQRIRDRRESDHESRRTAQPRYARSGSRPTSANGIHRRRNKRFAW
jgi:hypothetical protein